MALKAWFWVEAATLRSIAIWFKNALTFAASISLGCFFLGENDGLLDPILIYPFGFIGIIFQAISMVSIENFFGF